MSSTERFADTHDRARGRSFPSVLISWRNWKLPVKLGAVMLVPSVLAILLGVLVIRGQVATVATYTATQNRTSLAEQVRGVVSGVQAERLARVLAPRSGNRSSQGQAGDTAASVAALRKAFGATGSLDQAGESAWKSANSQLNRLGTLRNSTGDSVFSSSTLAGYYTDIVKSLLRLERVLLSKAGDTQLAGPAAATYDLDAAKEEVAFQQVTVLVGLDRNRLLPDETNGLRGSSTRFDGLVDDFRLVGGKQLQNSYDSKVAGASLDEHVSLLRQLLDTGSLRSLDVGQWNNASNAAISRMDRLGDTVSQQLRRDAGNLAQQSSNRTGLTAVVLFCALLVAVAVTVLIARQLLRSMRVLRRTAQHVAERELPDAVAEIQAGNSVATEITPVPVVTKEEIGQLARAFDAVHSEARRLAVEQASMRTSYGDVFVNLSRRSQNLVQRQLRLIERLERDEEDPDQLATLFQLDHLATRMRRNNENLLVLSGSEPSRGASHQPTSIADLLRAAISEIEQYQRVQMRPPPEAQIVGYATGDLVRLVAELLDNATAFSAPDTQVTISAHAPSDGSVIIDIADRGIGMLAKDIEQINERLAAGSGDEVPVSRRMGLFVVSRLANRHGISVQLRSVDSIDDSDGIRARVSIPRAVVVATELAPAQLAQIGPAVPLASEPGQVRPSEVTGEPEDVREPVSMPLFPVVTEPPPASSPAGGLFTPNGYGLDGPSLKIGAPDGRAASDVNPVEETTPIFDAMLSAWFVDSTPPESPRREDSPRSEMAERNGFDVWSVSAAEPAVVRPEPPAAEQPRWEFAADEDRQAVESVSSSVPEEFTSAGLPRRTPKAHLLPGSARHSEPTEPVSSSTRNPKHVRDRLGNFQRGLTQGRTTGESDSTGGREGAAFSGKGALEHTPAANGSGSSDVAGGDAREVQGPGGESPVPEKNSDADRWQFAADDGWRAAGAASRSAPEEFTSAGLPRRTPRARLVPGAAAEPGRSSSQRDADEVRNRLGSFQRGLADGRHNAAGPAQEANRGEREWE